MLAKKLLITDMPSTAVNIRKCQQKTVPRKITLQKKSSFKVQLLGLRTSHAKVNK